jgi:hypothetical protein
MILDKNMYESGMFSLNSFMLCSSVVIVDYEKQIFKVIKDRTELYDEEKELDLMFLVDYFSNKLDKEMDDGDTERQTSTIS